MTVQYRTSSVPIVKGAMFDLLASSPDLAGMQVCYGREVRYPEKEFVCVGDLRDSADQKWAAIGRTARAEDYELEVYVQAGGPGSSQREATERAFQLVGYVENALRSDEKLGLGASNVYQFIAAEVSRMTFVESPVTDPAGFSTFIVWTLHVMTRI